MCKNTKIILYYNSITMNYFIITKKMYIFARNYKRKNIDAF